MWKSRCGCEPRGRPGAGFGDAAKEKGLPWNGATLFGIVKLDAAALLRLRSEIRLRLFSGNDGHSLFLDTCALTTAATLEVEFGATYAAYLVELDRLDVRREQGESPFYTYAVGDLTDGKGCRMALALALDHIAFEALDTLLVTFYNFILNRDIITGLEVGELFLSRQLLVYK
jgi:hypothetical protein